MNIMNLLKKLQTLQKQANKWHKRITDQDIANFIWVSTIDYCRKKKKPTEKYLRLLQTWKIYEEVKEWPFIMKFSLEYKK